ncbi:MAG: CMP deaminase [Methanobacteriota archaeon]|nr:MAG: CMP deaminase [Euryarchaeota archaeon]
MNIEKFKRFYMDIAKRVSQLSYCERLKVGAVLVDSSWKNIISFGYNGTIPGFPNVCEGLDGKTIDEVLHAEENVLMKIARSNESCDGGILFITHAPCARCARLIAVSGIKKVFYAERYRLDKGLEILARAGISVEQIGG